MSWPWFIGTDLKFTSANLWFGEIDAERIKTSMKKAIRFIKDAIKRRDKIHKKESERKNQIYKIGMKKFGFKYSG